MHRQHKNDTNNDVSPIFASIPIGSTVVVNEKTVDHGPIGQLLGKEAMITMTHHTPYNLQQLVGESHTTDNISGQHPYQQTITYATKPQKCKQTN